MTNKIIINEVDGLSCSNCPEKERCNKQQQKKNVQINNLIDHIKEILNSNHISCYGVYLDHLKAMIPSVTRCDNVLEKQLQRKCKAIEALKKAVLLKENNRYAQACLFEAKKQECEELKEENYDLNMSLYQYVNTQKQNERYREALDKIKIIARYLYTTEDELTIEDEMAGLKKILCTIDKVLSFE